MHAGIYHLKLGGEYLVLSGRKSFAALQLFHASGHDMHPLHCIAYAAT